MTYGGPAVFVSICLLPLRVIFTVGRAWFVARFPALDLRSTTRQNPASSTIRRLPVEKLG